MSVLFIYIEQGYKETEVEFVILCCDETEEDNIMKILDLPGAKTLYNRAINQILPGHDIIVNGWKTSRFGSNFVLKKIFFYKLCSKLLPILVKFRSGQASEENKYKCLALYLSPLLERA